MTEWTPMTEGCDYLTCDELMTGPLITQPITAFHVINSRPSICPLGAERCHIITLTLIKADVTMPEHFSENAELQCDKGHGFL